MLLHACMHVGVFQALPGRLGGLQEPPGAGGSAQAEACLQRGVEGVFKGI